MALRQEELEDLTPIATIYRFPTERVEAARIRQGIARRQAARRRHRLGLGVIAVAVGVMTLLGGGQEAIAPASTSTPKTVVVQPGETLWDLAEEYAPEGMDLRVYVTAIAERNDIDLVVAAGTRLRLP